jgi:hypothetical protein
MLPVRAAHQKERTMTVETRNKPKMLDTSDAPTKNGFVYFIGLAVAIAIICLGVVIYSGRLPG